VAGYEDTWYAIERPKGGDADDPSDDGACPSELAVYRNNHRAAAADAESFVASNASCIMLVITDGGPYDSFGARDGRIIDPTAFFPAASSGERLVRPPLTIEEIEPVTLSIAGISKQLKVIVGGASNEQRISVTLDTNDSPFVTTTPAAVVAEGSATTRTASFILEAKSTGTATIKITAADGVTTETARLLVTVVNNIPPEIVEIVGNYKGSRELKVRVRDPDLQNTTVTLVLTDEQKMMTTTITKVTLPDRDNVENPREAIFSLGPALTGDEMVVVTVNDGVAPVDPRPVKIEPSPGIRVRAKVFLEGAVQ